LEPGQPIAVTFPASSEAIDALPGTKGGSPRVVPDETKLAITDSASRGAAMCKTFGAGGHCCLLLAIRGPTFFHCRSDEPVRFSEACTLGRSRSTAQLNVGKSRASKGLTELYEGLWRPPLFGRHRFRPRLRTKRLNRSGHPTMFARLGNRYPTVSFFEPIRIAELRQQGHGTVWKGKTSQTSV